MKSGKTPLGVVYVLLGLLFLWAVAFIVPATRDAFLMVFRPSATVGMPFLTGWPDGNLLVLSRDLGQKAVPPLQRGDRVIEIDGKPYRAGWDVARQVIAAGPKGTLRVEVARKNAQGGDDRIVSTIALRSVEDVVGSRALRALIAVLGLLMPWVCFLVGFWVAFVRPRDPLAWLVLFTLLGFQVAMWQQPTFGRWSDPTRVAGYLYLAAFGGAWPLFFPLFGIHFAGRLDFERRFGWVKWLVLVPLAASAALGVLVALGESSDWRSFVPLERATEIIQPLTQILGIIAITLFFLVVAWKRNTATDADAKRRLGLLQWGGCVAMTPPLILIIAVRILGRPPETFPVGVLVGALIFMPVFPLTLAYVILVDRAMDVRVAVRQGLRYAVTRGAIRTLVGLFLLGVGWNAWNLVNDPTANRPRKLQAIAWGMAAAVILPRFAKRAFEWTDRRFFREAYDVERVLTELSEEVRTIPETGPLLDTVLDRIGSTLHVDRLAVFLHEGDRLVTSRVRGFAAPPSLEISSGSELIPRLRESSRPLRIRQDDPESPLRREAIDEPSRRVLAQLDAELVLPLNGKNDLLGAITLGPKKSEEPYSPSDTKLLGSVAAQTGLALENSRLTATIVAEIAKREWIGREIDIARGVQQRLFPQKLPKIDGLDCAGACRTAQGVGGDYYDFLALPEGRLGIALGDVAGKGIPAALLMASLQASLRGQRLSGPSDLAQLMVNLNFLVHEASPENRYATFFYGEWDPGSRRLDYVNAGHNPPMLLRADGTLDRLPATGPVIGLVEAGRFEQKSVVLRPGDILLVYSDGISEAMNSADEEWGEDALASAASSGRNGSAQALLDHLFTAADAFAAGALQHDDMTVVVVRVDA